MKFWKAFAACLGGLVVLCLPLSIFGSHAMGADLNYTCQGGNAYTFEFSFYRDCAGISAPTSVILQLNSASCGISLSIPLTMNGSGVEVSPLCPAQIGSSSCNGGSLPGVEQYVYSGNYTLPQTCSDWIVSYSTCCRNALITNLQSASSQGTYIFAELDNTGGMCNSSPSFTTLPVPYICANQQFCYNHGAYDPDGDSLAYSLINPLSAASTNIPYNAGYNPNYPMTTVSGTVTFDPATGSMCVTPNIPQVSVVVIQVDEYRNGVRIGRTIRDLQIVVQNCSNQQPVMSNGGIYNSSGGVQLDSNSIEICPGDPMTFNVQFSDPNAGDNITVSTNLGTVMPGANFTQTGSNPVTGTFSWTPGAGDIGFNNFSITVQDDGCPFLGSQVYAFDIQVLEGTYAGPDQTYCTAGSPIQINATGGTIFNWNTLSGDASGLSCTSCANPMATPNQTSTYEVVSNLSATCKNRDTITIDFAPNFAIDAGLPDTICKYGQVTLNPSLAAGTYTYYWSPASGLSNPAIQGPGASPLSTTMYTFSATSALGCTLEDSVEVAVRGVAPFVILPPTDTICPGTNPVLTPLITYECDTSTSISCSGPVQTATLGTGASSTTTYGPGYQSTSGYSQKKQYIFTAAELQAQGFPGGMINSVSLDFTTGYDPITNLRVSMGCTTQDDYSMAPYMYLPTTEVMAPHTFNPVIGVNTFTFDYPYLWDGVSNLVLEFCTDDILTGLGSSSRYECLTGRYPTLYSNQYNIGGACSLTTGNRTTCRPNVVFNFCNAVPATTSFTWTPSGGLNDPTLLNPTVNVATTTNFTLAVDDGSGCIGNGNTSLVIDSTVYVNASATDPSPCVGDILNLTANATGNALPPTLPCGTNGTACTSPNYYNIGAGTFSTSTYSPFYGSYTDVKYQFLFHASELQAMGTPSGTISELAWNVVSKFTTGSFTNFRISLGCTNATELNTSTGWEATSLVYGPTTVTTATGWNTFTLNNNFDWDGSSNLVVEVCFDLGNSTLSTISYDNVQYATTGFYSTMRNYTNTTGSSGCSLPPLYRYTSRCNMRFGVCTPPPSALTYSWSPATGLSNPSAPTPQLTYVATTPPVYTVTVSGGRCPVTDTVSLISCSILDADGLELFGEANGNMSHLVWNTRTERDTDYFVLERSGENGLFREINRVKAAGNSSVARQYPNRDEQPLPGMNFYRVRLVDLNGETTLSNTVEILHAVNGQVLALYPNPYSGAGDVQLDLMAEQAGDVELTWLDALGRAIAREQHSVSSGFNHLELDGSDLANGTYFLRVKTDHLQEVKKFIVSR